jgi:pimeloyl-ACP methyl ester carboxylesterase
MVSERKIFQHATKDGITWHIEQTGSGPDIILIPDGLGDCAMFTIPSALIASAGFRVTTFDMPGLSRSSSAPEDTYTDITGWKLAKYINTLLEELGIQVASLWGCSSGASTVVSMASIYPERVRNVMPHELPTVNPPLLDDIASKSPDTIAAELSKGMEFFAGDTNKWRALGPDVHTRLHKNYVTWAYGYPRTIPDAAPVQKEHLHKRPIDWTIGADSPAGAFFENVVIAAREGLGIGLLPGRHFPYVSHPEEFAKYVIETCRKYL